MKWIKENHRIILRQELLYNEIFYSRFQLTNIQYSFLGIQFGEFLITFIFSGVSAGSHDEIQRHESPLFLPQNIRGWILADFGQVNMSLFPEILKLTMDRCKYMGDSKRSTSRTCVDQTIFAEGCLLWLWLGLAFGISLMWLRQLTLPLHLPSSYSFCSNVIWAHDW